MEKVSVIIPVYNREEKILEAIDSVLAQTYDNIEIIVVNDGSTDGTKDVLDKKALSSDKIKVIHQENTGVMGARIRGVNESTGEYIVFLDSDDLINPSYVAGLVNAQKMNNASIVLARRYQIMGALHLLYRKYPKTFSLSEYKEYLPTIWVGLNSKMYKREDLELLDIGLKANEDLAFNYYLMAKNNKVACANQSIYTQRYSPDSLALNLIYGNVAHIDNTLRPLEYQKRLFLEHDLFEFYKEEIEAIFIKNIYERIVNVDAQKNISVDKKLALKQVLIDYLAFHFPNYKANKYVLNHFRGFPFDSFFWFHVGNFKASQMHPSSPQGMEESIKSFNKLLK